MALISLITALGDCSILNAYRLENVRLESRAVGAFVPVTGGLLTNNYILVGFYNSENPLQQTDDPMFFTF